MNFRSITLVAVFLAGLDGGAAFASSCSLGQWRSTGVDMGDRTVEYAYNGAEFSDMSYGLGAAPLAPGMTPLHGGYSDGDRISGTFTVQFDGDRYCTSDFDLNDGVATLGQSESFYARDVHFSANLRFDAQGNVTNYLLTALSSGVGGDHHFLSASSTSGDIARHSFEFVSTARMYGFSMLASESASASTASIGRLSEVPLPGTLPLAAAGLLAFGALRRRARRG